MECSWRREQGGKQKDATAYISLRAIRLQEGDLQAYHVGRVIQGLSAGRKHADIKQWRDGEERAAVAIGFVQNKPAWKCREHARLETKHTFKAAIIKIELNR